MYIMHDMGESQSRYSIVERLTQRKLDIIKSKSNLDFELNEANGKIAEAEAAKSAYLKEQEVEKEAAIARYDEEIARANRNVQRLEESKEQRGIAYDEQVKAIEQALAQLKDISDSAASQASQS